MRTFTKKISSQSGFTLIELIVGLVIGLIASVVIMQTFSSFEGNKRSTTGIADAQTNGSIGLYMIQRELQFAGYGIPAVSGTMPKITPAADGLIDNNFVDYTGKTQTQINATYASTLADYNTKIAANSATVQAGEVYSALKCNPAPTLSLDVDNDSTTLDVTVDVITPVVITNGATSDTVSISYGTTNRGAMSTNITSTAGTNTVGVQNNMGCRSGDVVLVTKNSNSPDNNTACVATTVTSTDAQLDATTNTISVDTNAGMTKLATERFYRLSCLGEIRHAVFAVNANQLTKNNQPVISEVVSLQAQYGVSATANSELVNQWVDASGATWATPTVANRNRIKAVRLAIVARNNLLEKEVVSQGCTGAAVGPAKVCVWGANINLTAIPSWSNYRYRTYEIVVPLRNMLAASPQL
jgi:type IV pilus assembly protein PilW